MSCLLIHDLKPLDVGQEMMTCPESISKSALTHTQEEKLNSHHTDPHKFIGIYLPIDTGGV